METSAINGESVPADDVRQPDTGQDQACPRREVKAPETTCSHSEPLLDWPISRAYCLIPVRVERTRGTPKGGHAMTGFNASAFVSARIISPSSLAD
ncbi:hypothetical protein EMO91_08630 [Bifidobacterium myosotis]|uniref:Uncharacterized protein n=1 Tax=Bifidobacterium myosotis TaxID=1630166 RepID=A0A5M9ZIP6_9BIFI|nr:hypothetical protein EMO91_08630 [Bifidobacterium myosotis]